MAITVTMIKFVLLVNKQGQTRLSQYYEYVSTEERVTTEADIVRKCLARNEDQVGTNQTTVYDMTLVLSLFFDVVFVYGVYEL